LQSKHPQESHQWATNWMKSQPGSCYAVHVAQWIWNVMLIDLCIR
jgi:hypothetical protein